tara:strand:- start:1619 stop:2389 length:771 start_codon:yes stop_codon:yes gene_type:complete
MNFMEFLSQFGMREWLIAGGLALVLSVLVDGYRRMRSERKDNMKLSLGMGGGFDDETSQTSELPSGGARVIKRTDPIISEQGADDLFSSIPEPSAVEYDDVEQDFDSSVAAISEREIIVIHVKSNALDGFNGSDLLQILIACDMRYGDKDILHRHEQAEGNGSLQFSLANMIEPGTFNIDDINSFRTPGVTFFMTLPGPKDPLTAFDCMIETANCLVSNLDATLLDEDHTAASTKSIKAYRSRVSQFSSIKERETA